MEDERRALAARMTDKAAKLLLDMPLRQMRRLEEMRFYAGQNACFVFDGRGETQNVFFSQRDVDELVTALCSHSRYAYETQLAQGYIPLGNGCRAGSVRRVNDGESGRAFRRRPLMCIRVARDSSGGERRRFAVYHGRRRAGLPRAASRPAGMRQDDGASRRGEKAGGHGDSRGGLRRAGGAFSDGRGGTGDRRDARRR